MHCWGRRDPEQTCTEGGALRNSLSLSLSLSLCVCVWLVSLTQFVFVLLCFVVFLLYCVCSREDCFFCRNCMSIFFFISITGKYIHIADSHSHSHRHARTIHTISYFSLVRVARRGALDERTTTTFAPSSGPAPSKRARYSDRT